MKPISKKMLFIDYPFENYEGVDCIECIDGYEYSWWVGADADEVLSGMKRFACLPDCSSHWECIKPTDLGMLMSGYRDPVEETQSIRLKILHQDFPKMPAFQISWQEFPNTKLQRFDVHLTCN